MYRAVYRALPVHRPKNRSQGMQLMWTYSERNYFGALSRKRRGSRRESKRRSPADTG